MQQEMKMKTVDVVDLKEYLKMKTEHKDEINNKAKAQRC